MARLSFVFDGWIASSKHLNVDIQMSLLPSTQNRRHVLTIIATLTACQLCIAHDNDYQTIEWTVLMPEDWVKAITKDFDELYKISNLQDGSPQATKAMQSLRKKFDEAPIVKNQLNKRIRIAGYVVPLDANRDQFREFLLVPYFGACIHSPPPPANQIIIVKSSAKTKFSKLPESMDMVWIVGELKESRVPTAQGMSGYSIAAVSVVPYEDKGLKK